MNPDRIDPSAWLPQSGSMVLLDAVTRWDATQIVCRTISHRRVDHPLASDGRLPVWAGIEYAGQAMAIHRALCRIVPTRPAAGFLGGLRDVACAVERLDDIAGELTITATSLFADGAGSIYRFAVCAGRSEVPLISGRATVVQPGVR
jgi:predicted hotdog family 3-hydroxylacyl-ACP dehydratase